MLTGAWFQCDRGGRALAPSEDAEAAQQLVAELQQPADGGESQLEAMVASHVTAALAASQQ